MSTNATGIAQSARLKQMSDPRAAKKEQTDRDQPYHHNGPEIRFEQH